MHRIQIPKVAVGLVFGLLFLTALGRAGGELPALVIPETAGMQLRGNYSSDADLDQFVAIGVKNVRMGFHWEGIEKVKGVYDFANLDAIMARVRSPGEWLPLSGGHCLPSRDHTVVRLQI
ncbi:MAG: hypothetical protein ACAI37_06480 [Chthoniobacter sp.]